MAWQLALIQIHPSPSLVPSPAWFNIRGASRRVYAIRPAAGRPAKSYVGLSRRARLRFPISQNWETALVWNDENGLAIQDNCELPHIDLKRYKALMHLQRSGSRPPSMPGAESTAQLTGTPHSCVRIAERHEREALAIPAALGEKGSFHFMLRSKK